MFNYQQDAVIYSKATHGIKRFWSNCPETFNSIGVVNPDKLTRRPDRSKCLQQRQTAVTGHFSSSQLLLFAFVRITGSRCPTLPSKSSIYKWIWAAKHKTLNECWPNVRPPSTTLAQLYANIGSTSRVCWLNWWLRGLHDPLFVETALN